MECSFIRRGNLQILKESFNGFWATWYANYKLEEKSIDQ